MALGRLSVATVVSLVAFASGCRTRDVFLAPREQSLQADAGRGSGGRQDSGMPPEDSGIWLHTDGGRRPSCETSRYPEEPQPLGVYIMIDQSSAMGFLWPTVTGALSEFIQQSGALGKVSVGIKFFALSSADVEPTQNYLDVVCQSSAYESPIVGIAPLPAAAPALLDAISKHQPSLLSAFFQTLGLAADIVPTDAALAGAVTGAASWVTQNAAARPKAVVLLVTNGIPTSSIQCLPTLDTVESAAANGFTGQPSVPTYVLDVGTEHTQLNGVANAGGTDHAYSAQSNADMLVALQSIRERALPCEIDVGAYADSLDKLNVELSTGDGSTRFSKLPDGQSTCDPNRNDEWYLEGTGPEARVRLCANTCVHARSVTDATIDVVLGCRTTVD
ncbi:MAG TPA: hypothetical protein VHE30_10585 [Polyangiaceae bacterium]|nr:hypothetical protein [Polyangiaceae bacterium]